MPAPERRRNCESQLALARFSNKVRGGGNSLFTEIKRRNVLQGVITYAVAGWLIIQLAIALEAALELPTYVDRWATIAVIAGFPVALVTSWFFDISLDGIRLTPKAEKPEPQPLFTEAALAGRGPTQKRSVAVLPFADMSSAGDQEYFADGMSEEILNALVKVTELKVAGRTSSFAFKGRNEDLRAIGEALNVAHVLEGSVRKQGDKVRITAQLIQASDGFHLWSETYDSDLTDIFDLQDSIAKSIVEQMQIVLDTASQPRLASNLTSSPEAYEYFLRARPLVHQMSGQDTLPKAVELLEQAVGLDPNFAEAWAWLADAHYSLPDQSPTRKARHHFECGRRAVARSMELDPDAAHVYHAAGYRASVDRRVDQLVAMFHKGHRMDPSDAEMMTAFGIGLNALGLFERGLPLIREGLAQEPLMPAHLYNAALGEWALGDVELAGKTLRRSFELGGPEAVFLEAYRLACVSSAREAIDYIRQRKSRLERNTTQYFVLPFTWFLVETAIFRKVRPVRWILGQALTLLIRFGIATPTVASAFVYLFIGDAKGLFRAVRRYRTPNLYLLTQMIMLPTEEARRIRTHRAFPAFAEEIGLVKGWQTYGWPPLVRPHEGTDGSDLQFTVM